MTPPPKLTTEQIERILNAPGGWANAVQDAADTRDQQWIEMLAGQEPVATDWERIARVQDAKLRAMCGEAGGFEKLCEVMDKYEARTQPQREWVGLTDEEIAFCRFEARVESGPFKRDGTTTTRLARAIEAKLREKNGGGV